MSIQMKIQRLIDDLCTQTDIKGKAHLSVCNYTNWDKDAWDYHPDIVNTIRSRGYNVSCVVNHGVTDIGITKLLNFK
tara:strand:+ start:402 stop:632 length:231 start_codon:yes stop_codon:yes gene_type:complete